MNYNYYNCYYTVNNFNPKPYMVKNMLYENKDSSIQNPVSPSTAPSMQSGYLAVRVLSKSGEPIKDALVTVIHFHDDGEVHVHYNVLTDENGNVPLMKLDVRFEMPGHIDESPYTAYNLRAFAKDFYPVNIIHFRIYPNVETDYTFEMTPLDTIEFGPVPEETIVYP